MSALETTAVLTNNLVQLLEDCASPSLSDLEAIFASTQETRQPRADALVDVSALTQDRFAMATAWLRFMNRWYFPAMGPRSALRLLSEAYPGAASFQSRSRRSYGKRDEKTRDLPGWLSKATSGHALPYEDELMAPPRPRSVVAKRMITSMLLFLSFLGLYSKSSHPTSSSDVGDFISIQIPVSVMMLVEGSRKRNTWSLIWR